MTNNRKVWPRLVIVLAAVLITSFTARAQQFSDWSAPTEVVALNSCGPPVLEVNEYFE